MALSNFHLFFINRLGSSLFCSHLSISFPNEFPRYNLWHICNCKYKFNQSTLNLMQISRTSTIYEFPWQIAVLVSVFPTIYFTISLPGFFFHVYFANDNFHDFCFSDHIFAITTSKIPYSPPNKTGVLPWILQVSDFLKTSLGLGDILKFVG